MTFGAWFYDMGWRLGYRLGWLLCGYLRVPTRQGR